MGVGRGAFGATGSSGLRAACGCCTQATGKGLRVGRDAPQESRGEGRGGGEGEARLWQEVGLHRVDGVDATYALALQGTLGTLGSQ